MVRDQKVSPGTRARKKTEFLRRQREYEVTRNPLLVLEAVVEAARYEIPLPKWALRAQAKMNEAILRVGRSRYSHPDLASAITRAMGLTKTGRGTVFGREERQAHEVFLGYEMQRWRQKKRRPDGRLPSLVDTYAEFTIEEGISERQLRRIHRRYVQARRKGNS